jgi:hypothetical protein
MVGRLSSQLTFHTDTGLFPHRLFSHPSVFQGSLNRILSIPKILNTHFDKHIGLLWRLNKIILPRELGRRRIKPRDNSFVR